MTPQEALFALISADPNRSYTVSRHDSAHLPLLAGQPPNFRITWDVSCHPGLGEAEWRASGFFGVASLPDAVSALVARLERERDWTDRAKPQNVPQPIGNPLDLRDGAE